ncbi:transcription factor bHLH67 [Tripterygium wilfordii]|uniref:transcription factor bHLH67 n=1 Tax=Tripterygium wilfordii TaxID=458696 RepID=UPI0018F80617|nr:transcription factor bHLH67 [Tripterygium wilfordii]
MLVTERESERGEEFKAYFNNFCTSLMEKLQGPINPCFIGENLDVEYGLQQGLLNAESLNFEEEEPHYPEPSLEDKMPFLQMLQSAEHPQFVPLKEPNFQTLLRLQHLKKPWEMNTYMPAMETRMQTVELESCITHDIVDLHSPVKSEKKNLQNPHSTTSHEGVSSESIQELPSSAEPCLREGNSGCSPPWPQPQTKPRVTHVCKPSPVTKERKKRKRTKPTKDKEEIENQRMTHITVERNRRRQMNDHLNSLRSLMPPSYIQRGDQASIIGGAIDFVKELEQLLQSLEAQKRMRKTEPTTGSGISSNGLSAFPPPQNCQTIPENPGSEGAKEETKDTAQISVTVIQSHVNLKIESPRRPGQLLKVIVALEDLRLTVLHLNITSSQYTIFYSFNLKIEEECKLRSADEIAAAVHQIFS